MATAKAEVEAASARVQSADESLERVRQELAWPSATLPDSSLSKTSRPRPRARSEVGTGPVQSRNGIAAAHRAQGGPRGAGEHFAHRVAPALGTSGIAEGAAAIWRGTLQSRFPLGAVLRRRSS